MRRPTDPGSWTMTTRIDRERSENGASPNTVRPSRVSRHSKNEKSELSRSSIRVLVVDDFAPLANALVDMLATNFYDARAAHSAAEGLNIAEEFRPHLLIADVSLPGADGFRFAMEFERRYPDAHVLLTSAGYSSSENVNGLRVVVKASLLEEAFRLLDRCRRSNGSSWLGGQRN